ncbi:cupin domain-containing protein [Calditerricola satsumensis]|uniref:DNA-binding protein n=1 Tax=Calditerricola satsumensis TaxID=373054 RepID=A0A8J3FE94_9BACI|nr:cupin domain-containing protein [Calditerricola satsumensis]GGK07479.1 DNA-binding protein [Calditerricola satsumensis]
MEEISRKIRELRQSKNMTLKELSERTGLSIGFLSQVERGSSSLAITSLQKIAEALEVPIVTFFQTEENPNYVVRVGERKPFRIEGSPANYVRLSGRFAGRALEPLLVELAPRQAQETPFSHPGEEFYFVLEGRITLVVDDTPYELSAGDSIHFPSTIPHAWRNDSDQPARVLCVLTPAIF